MHQQPQEGPNRERGRGEVDRAGGNTVEGQEGEVEVEAEGSTGQVVAWARRGAGVEVRGDRVHHGHPYIHATTAATQQPLIQANNN